MKRFLCMCSLGILSATLSSQTVIVVEEGPSNVVIFPAKEPSRQVVIKLALNPHEIELTPDHRTAYVSNFGLLEASHRDGIPGTTISVLDVEHRKERTRFSLPAGYTAPHGLKLRPPQFRELFTNTEEGHGGMVVFDSDTGVVLRTFPLPAGIHNFVFNSDGSALFAYTVAGELSRIDPDSGKVTATTKLQSIRGLSWSAGGRTLIAGGKGEVYLITPSDLSVTRHFDTPGVRQIFHVAATRDGRWLLAPAVLDGVVLVIDTQTGAVVRSVETGSPFEIALDPDGKHAWVSNVIVPLGMFGATKARDGGLVRIDLTTFTTTAIPGIRDTNGVAVASH